MVSEECAIEVRAENPLNIQTSVAGEKRKKEAQRKSRQAKLLAKSPPGSAASVLCARCIALAAVCKVALRDRKTQRCFHADDP